MQDPETEVICVWNEQGESEEKVKSRVCGAMSKLSFLKSLKKSHLGLLTMIELNGDKVGPTNFGYFYKIALQHYSHTSTTHKYYSQFPQL